MKHDKRSALDKKLLVERMTDQRLSEEFRSLQMQTVALMEIREAIEVGFAKLDQTKVEGAMMLVGCKESLDTFLEDRLKTDKILSSVQEAVGAMQWKEGEKQDPPVDEPENSAVTLDVGDFGGPVVKRSE